MYDIGPLFFYRPMFVAELLIAEAMFCVALRRKKRFALRVALGALICFGVSFALPVVAFDTLFCSLLFLILFAASVAAMAFAFDEPLKNILFCAIAGYTVQHFASETFELFSAAADLGEVAPSRYGSGNVMVMSAVPFVLVAYAGIYYSSYIAAYLLFARRVKIRSILSLGSGALSAIVLLFVLINVVFSQMVLWDMSGSGRVGTVMLRLYNVICCALSCLLLFEMPRRRSAEREMSEMKRIGRRAAEQYEASKANIEMINIKFHDLKHRLRELTRGSFGAAAELERAVDAYDAHYETTSEALNVVLTEKGLLCKKEHIKFTCMADGDCVKFMSDGDIYAMFGNMFDNAIEAVRALGEDKRVIGLTVARTKGFVVVRMYNTFSGALVYDGGLPVTTKRDASGHGFGLKSIRYIAGSYGGEMRIDDKGGIFTVTVLFGASRHTV